MCLLGTENYYDQQADKIKRPMLTQTIIVPNKLGLHARAAAKFATTAARFEASIQPGVGSRMVDGKSVMSLMLLAASQGTELTLITEGDDQQAAMQALIDLIEDKFGEGE